ncbi:MAG: cytochrome c biogenesis protein ResB, partial [Dehalococcoidia bacterium]|nr:cytochrome c biogenesis protein ResB [Dehalococcoidia bacterium]
MNDASLTQARRLWRFLVSVRLALVLILIVVAASLAGALIIQAPEGVLSSPTSYERWIDGLRPSFGSFTGLMDFMGLFQIFQTWWFNALAALLVLNLIACTINRFPATWRVARHPRINVGQGFFGHGRRRAWLSPTAISPREMADSVVEALRRRRYRVTTHDDGDDIYVYGERNRYGRFGTFFTHGGIVLILAAALWGNLTGFRDD